MRVGICYNIDYVPEVHGSPQEYFNEILAQVDILEETGYDTVWFSEHHCEGYSFGNPAVMAAAAAARTKRIRIGTGVSLVPLHHPIFLAEQYGMLDVLSGGRLEYGVGRGYIMHEYDWLNIKVGDSHERYREAMEFIVKAWSGDGSPMDFDGKHFKVDGYTYFPKPVQRPIPPIYASGGGTPDSFRWAGEMGFNLGTALFIPDRDFIRNNIKMYRDALVEHGHDPSLREVAMITQMFCAKDQAEAVDDGGRYATNYYRFFSKLDRSPVKQGMAAYYETADARDMNAGDFVLFGTPENLVERINRLGDDLNFDLLLMEVAQGSAPPAKVRSALELFGREVIPRLKKREGAPKVAAA